MTIPYASTDPEYVSNVLVDALALGDVAAAKRWKIDPRTVRRYRVRQRTDTVLAALVKEKSAEVSHDLAVLRVAFLREALAAARDKLPTATLYETAGAIKIVGELHQTAMMVGDDELQPDTESEVAVEAEGGSGSVPSGADGEALPRH